LALECGHMLSTFFRERRKKQAIDPDE
jgi:hypothetical protein